MRRNGFIFPLILIFITLSHALYMSLLIVSHYTTQREYLIQAHYALNVQQSLLQPIKQEITLTLQENLKETLTHQLQHYTQQQLSTYHITKQTTLQPNHYLLEAQLNQQQYQIEIIARIYMDPQGNPYINQQLFPIYGLWNGKKRIPFDENADAQNNPVPRQSKKYYTFKWELTPPAYPIIYFTNGQAQQQQSNTEHYFTLSLDDSTLTNKFSLAPRTLSIQMEWIAQFTPLN